MKFAAGTYGWPFRVLQKGTFGCCRFLCSGRYSSYILHIYLQSFVFIFHTGAVNVVVASIGVIAMRWRNLLLKETAVVGTPGL